MKNSLSKVLLLTSTMLSAAAPALAQDGGDEIVVTARRTEEKLQDVPISITVFSQEQLASRNIVSAGELATYTPSLTANNRFGAESTSFAIRGFTQEGPTSPSVAVYFADVVAPRANGGTVNGNGAGVGSMFDLQNVQVLKGPQGTLFGRNTTGGAVLLVPQKPKNEFGGYIEGSVGNYDMQRLQGVVNVPINDNVRFRLGVDAQKRDGYLKNISGVGPSDFADTNYWAARASLVVDITPTLENYTIVSFSDSDTNGFAPKVFTPNFTATTSARARNAINAQIASTNGRDFWDVSNGAVDPYQKIQQWGIINTTTWEASEGLTVKNIVSYTEFKQAQSAHIFGDSAVGSNPPLAIFNFGTDLQPFGGKDNTQQATFTDELQVQGNALNDRLTYQAGVYGEFSEPLNGFQATISSSFLDCVNLLTYQCRDVLGASLGIEGLAGSGQISASKYEFQNLGAYAQGTYKLTDQWSLTAGIRYTSDKTEGEGQIRTVRFPAPGNNPQFSCAIPAPLTQGGNSAQIQADPSRCSFRRKAESEKPTWLIDLDYKPTDDILLYAKYARGYRQGNINVSSYGFESWGPEKVDTYEIGAKTSFGGALRGVFNIAAFHNDLDNQQLQATLIACTGTQLATLPAQCPFVPSSAAGIIPNGKSKIDGVEIDASISPLPGLKLEGNYAYLDTQLKSITLPPPPLGFSSVGTRVIVGGPLALTPENKYSLTGSYTLPLDDSVGVVTLAATFTHTDGYFNNAQTPLAFQNLPGYDNLNLNASWNSIFGKPVDLALFATNVTEEEAYLSTVGASSFSFDAAILNAPSMYGMRLKYHFGG